MGLTLIVILALNTMKYIFPILKILRIYMIIIFINNVTKDTIILGSYSHKFITEIETFD